MSGLRPNFSRQEDEPEFVSHEGVFLQACRKAVENSTTPHLLFIDEINRANTSRVFGDLMLVIETSKRVSVKNFRIIVKNFTVQYLRLMRIFPRVSPMRLCKLRFIIRVKYITV